MPTIGERLHSAGYSPNLPLIVVPGLCSSILKVKETTYEPWMDKRVWLNLSAIGMGKVWDFNVTLFGDSKKKTSAKKDAALKSSASGKKLKKSRASSQMEEEEEEEEEVENAGVDDNLKRRWIKHMVLQEDGFSDPPGIQLRAVEGLRGCAYLEPSNRATKALSYVFGPFFEMLQDIGYDDTNLTAVPYDWRIPPSKLQERDGYFTKMAQIVEESRSKNNKRVVLLGHSLGTRVVQYFLRWAADQPDMGREWIDQNVETFIAVGPIFLGAPKTFRAMITGERMGLEAFLFPEEGVALNRRIGSIPWMFPTRLPAHDGDPLMRMTMLRKGQASSYEPIEDEALMKIVYPPMYDIYKKHYEADPLHGPHEAMVDPIPVENLYAIYGVNLETESFCFVRPAPAGADPPMELDTDGALPTHKCKAGIGYETKATPQKVLNGACRSGDGTVPYASLSYCQNWTNHINVKIDELEQCDHRDILKDKRFLRNVVKYICRNPPPPELPESFPDLKYPVTASFGGRKYDCTLKIQRPCITVTLKGRLVGGALQTKVRYQAINAVFVDDLKPGVFIIDAPGANRIRKLRSKFRREIVEEIASRCRYADRLADLQDELGEEDESLLALARRDERDAFGQTALHRAASENKLDAVKEQLSLQVDVNAVDANGWTPLHCAAKRGHIDVLLELLSSEEINTNMVNKEGLSALHYLMQISYSGTDELHNLAKLRRALDSLLKKGANVNLPAGDEETALHKACLRGNINAIEWLLKQEVDIDSTNKHGDTALHVAVKAKQKRVVFMLMFAHCSLFIPNKVGETPLHLAVGHKDLFGLLCGVTASQLKEPQFWLKSSSDIVRMGMFKAIQEQRMDWAFELLRQQKREAFSAVDREGLQPLHLAAKQGPINILQMLLNHTLIDASATTADGAGVIGLLVQHRAGIDDLSDERLVALLELALAKGAQVNEANALGETALHAAVRQQSSDVIDWLLTNEATVDMPTTAGETPLHFAVRAGDISIVKRLIDNGGTAQYHKKGSNCGTPLELAASTNPAILDFLRPKRERGSRASLILQLNGATIGMDPNVAIHEPTREGSGSKPVPLKNLQGHVNNKRCTNIFRRQSTLRPQFSGGALVQEDPNPSLLRSVQQKNLAIPGQRTAKPRVRSPLVEATSSSATLSPVSAMSSAHQSHLRPTPPARGRRGGMKIATEDLKQDIGKQEGSEWNKAMSVIAKVNQELVEMDFTGASANKSVTVHINGLGTVTKIEAKEDGSDADRVQALNVALGKQRRAAVAKSNKALEGVVSKETLDVLNGCMYACSV